jgi:ketosteroid isomerase-like protein
MSDVEVVKQIYAAMADREIPVLLELVDPQCVITQDSRLPWGGRFVGHDGLAAFAAALTGAITSAVTTEALFEADGDVIQCAHARHDRRYGSDVRHPGGAPLDGARWPRRRRPLLDRHLRHARSAGGRRVTVRGRFEKPASGAATRACPAR